MSGESGGAMALRVVPKDFGLLFIANVKSPLVRTFAPRSLVSNAPCPATRHSAKVLTLFNMSQPKNIAWVYIITNDAMTVLYTGYTTNLPRRLQEHRTKRNPKSFTAQYEVHKLLYYNGYHSVESAKAVEKKIKGKTKAWKVNLINSMNPEWKDLTSEVC
jgi:putative endonuclease